MRDKPYHETVGSAQYAAYRTQLNITYVVNTLSRYLENPSLAHWNAVKHCFGYLLGTADWKLTYGKVEKDLEGYADADGSMHKDQKAISGHAFMIDGGPCRGVQRSRKLSHYQQLRQNMSQQPTPRRKLSGSG